MAESEAKERLDRLVGFLEHDPDNAILLRDAAQTSLDADEFDQAKALFTRLRDLGALTDGDSNLWAIAAMRSGEPVQAAETFAGLLERQPEDTALKFNLAWARALAQDAEGARAALDAETVDALPQAAQLELQLMHAAGEFDEAAERAKQLLERHPDYPPLLAAVSVLAMDIEDEALARECAEKADGHPDAITTLATLQLGGDEPEKARAMFEQSLAINAQSPRAWVGLGLADMIEGKNEEAGRNIDKGAEMFGTHLGSWIAAGWAYLLAGDRAKARERFERSIEIDDTFSEGQGSLAVMDLLDGETEAAERRVEIALRLDRQSFSAAFAKVLITSAAGDTETAQRIMEIALKQPIMSDGRTIADMIARMAR
jgi:tetratricopeptide (TPR) repeat protein